MPNPTYEMVCSKSTGHVEVVLVEFDPKRLSYEQILDKFFAMHNPVQRNGQGVNLGSNYRSAIFFYGPEQEATAKRVRDRLQQSKYKDRPIATEIAPAGRFWMAEDYHQQYYEKRGLIPSCRVG